MTTEAKAPSLRHDDLARLLEAGKQGKEAVRAVLREFWQRKESFYGEENIGHPSIEVKEEE